MDERLAKILAKKGFLSPQDLVSHAYLLPWFTNRPNVFIKGAKGSGKSFFVSLWLVFNIMQQKCSSALVIRKVYDTILGSCYLDIKNAIYFLGVQDLWKCTTQPMQFIYEPTGQSIIFRGLDDAYKLASIRAPPGCYLCWVWFEEVFEVLNYEDILKIQASIRAIPPETGLKKKFFYTFNPWHPYHWLKEEIFDKERDDTLALTTTYLDNPAFTADDRKFYEDLEKYNPKAARVIVHGEWGISEGLIYENWETRAFDPEEIARRPGIRKAIGLDFGYSVSYVDLQTHEIWICDEMYKKGMTNLDIAKEVTRMGYAHERIMADCAEPKSIYELKHGLMDQDANGNIVRYTLPNIEPVLKGRDSVVNGIQRIQTFKIWVHPKCVSHIAEFSAYCWKKDKDGKYTGDPEKEHDHLMDGFRYALMQFLRQTKGFVAVARGSGVDEFDMRRSRPVISSIDPSAPEPRRCVRVAVTHE